MRKFTCSFAMICTVAAAAFLGACSKNSDKSCDGSGACCKDKAAAKDASVKTDAQATPAATSGCSGKCTGEKKCPMSGQAN